ncbi:hypothetical protein [Winogradskyella rapida]|uniref:Uncharacterized protein n=1 Tax=Winogradskyella rapida TaxID=549701 RepID=A0ABW3KRU8_9FLAO
MEINQVTVPSFTAEITIGLNKGYSNDAWTLNDLKHKLVRAQQKLRDTERILLSVKLTLCDIVFLGQDEPSVTLSFINYPKFQIEHQLLKKGVLFIAEQLMKELNQNRIVIVFKDQTVMLEASHDIDNNIQLGL